MARDEELNFRVTADTARAVDNVDELADKVGDLEDQPHDVEVKADTAAAEQAARQLDARLAGLPREQQIAILAKLEERSKRDLDQLNRDLANAARFSDQELELKLRARDEASAKLNAVQAEIREIDGATPTVDVEVRANGLDDLIGKLDNLPGRAGAGGAAIAAAFANPAAALAALGGGVLALAKNAGDAALQVAQVANMTGSTVEQASALVGVWSRSGGEIGDLLDILGQMNGVLADQPELAAQLGIKLNDGRNLGERFTQVVDLLGSKFTDVGERGRVASQLFGEEGVRQVNALVTLINGPLTEAVDKFRGPVFTDQDVENARKANEQAAEFETNARKIGVAIGTWALPVFNAGLGTLNQQLTNAYETGVGIRRVFDSQADANFRVIESYEASARAVAEFDRAQLDGLTTVEQVRARVIELTGDLGAAAEIAVEWARANGVATNAVESHSQTLGKIQAQQDAYVGGLERAGRAQRDLSADVDETTEAVDGQRVSWQDFAAALTEPLLVLQQIQGVIDSVQQQTVDGIIGGARSDLDARQRQLDYIDALDAVRQAELNLADVRSKKGDESIEAARAERDLERANIRLQESVLRLVESYDNLPLEKVTTIRAAIDRGDYEEVMRILDDLDNDRFVKIRTFEEQLRSAISNASIGINPGGTPSAPTYTPSTTPPPAYVDQRTTNNYFPPGVVPTEVVAATTIDGRRGGRS